MYKLVIASHGSLAEGMRSAARMILNRDEHIFAFGLDTYEEPEEILRLVRNMLTEEPDTIFYILCDIKGGSVHNQLMQLLPSRNVYLMCGVNLSMVLTLATLERHADPRVAVQEAIKLAQSNIQFFDPVAVAGQQEKEDQLW